jgi:hypothetical protein
MSDSYAGRCIGGPWNGQMREHWCKQITLQKPMMEFSMSKPIEETRVEAVTFGWYYYDSDRKIWYWSGPNER